MKRLLLAMTALTVGIASGLAQEKPPVFQELRVYLLDRAVPKRPLKDASAAIRIAPESGPDRTLLVPLVAQGPLWEGQNRTVDMIRGLVGTPYFTELTLWDTPQVTVEGTQASAVPTPKPASVPLTSEEILRRAHHGPCFVLKVPSSLFASPCKVTITIRLEDQTFASEGYQIPSTPSDEAVGEALETLQTLTNRVDAGATFMELKPQAVKFLEEVAMLAPAAFRDETGALENDRQWCLAVGRAIEDACDQGNGGLIQNLASECGPRLRRMREFMAAPRNQNAESRSP